MTAPYRVDASAPHPGVAAAPCKWSVAPPAYDRILGFQLEELKLEGRYRYFTVNSRHAGAFPRTLATNTAGSREITVWCSNDYLGMGQHPKVLAAMADAIARVGAGSGGTRNISGTTHYHVDLEAELADLHGKEAALLFTSAFVANEAALSTLARLLPGCVILSDEKNHASMIAGIRNGRGPKFVFRHNDLDDLEAKLKALPVQTPKMIAFESVYSMDGNIAPIEEICNLAAKYSALTYLDEVHAVGLRPAGAAADRPAPGDGRDRPGHVAHPLGADAAAHAVERDRRRRGVRRAAEDAALPGRGVAEHRPHPRRVRAVGPVLDGLARVVRAERA